MINLKILFLLLSLILSAVAPVRLLAQLTDTTGQASGLRGTPRIYKFGARTVALGDATVADPTNLTAININPATLSFVKDISVIQANSYQNWNNNLMMETVTFPVLSSHSHSVAAQLGIHHGGSKNTNYLGTSPLPQPNILMYQFDVAYSYSIENVLSIGVLNNFTYAQSKGGQFWTYFPTIGLLYAPTKSLSYGISFRGLGRSVVYQFIEDGRTTLGSQDLREVLELGATLQFPVDTDNTYLSISLANEKRFGEDGVWYKAGLEVSSIPFVALRAGMLFQPESNIYGPRFGLGIHSKLIEVDYAVSYVKDMINRYHQLGITIHL